MIIDGKLHKVPCVQFFFSDNNAGLPKSIKSMLTIQGISWLQVLTII